MKPGYKQTEVGVIPEEWKVSPLGELATFLSGGTPSRSNDEYWTGEIPWISATSLRCFYIYRSGSNVTKEAVAAGSKMAPIGATLLLVRGSALHNEILSGLVTKPVCFNQDVKALVPNSQIAPKYLTFVMLGRAPELLGLVSSAGNTAGVLDTKLLKAFGILLPPVPEQRAIAEALSDVDGLLGGLDRLIVKKRDLKQAAMQQLLTGQTRLPGFHGEWEVKRLGDAFTISAGKSKSAYVVENGDFWVCDMGSVSIEGRLIVSKRTNYSGDFLKRGDLIMPKDDIGGGNIIGKVGYVDANDTYILGDHVYCLRALEGDPRFLAYVINSHRVNSELRKKVIGSAQLGLGRKSVTEQEIQFPPHPEQTAIATVLSEMDGELAVLEQRREKTRALKQAMMQELLTGRTRLV